MKEARCLCNRISHLMAGVAEKNQLFRSRKDHVEEHAHSDGRITLN